MKSKNIIGQLITHNIFDKETHIIQITFPNYQIIEINKQKRIN